MRFTDHKDGTITVEWTLNYEEMIELSYIVHASSLGGKGKVRDQGWYDDSVVLFEAADEAQSREDSEDDDDRPGVRIGVVMEGTQ